MIFWCIFDAKRTWETVLHCLWHISLSKYGFSNSLRWSVKSLLECPFRAINTSPMQQYISRFVPLSTFTPIDIKEIATSSITFDFDNSNPHTKCAVFKKNWIHAKWMLNLGKRSVYRNDNEHKSLVNGL